MPISINKKFRQIRFIKTLCLTPLFCVYRKTMFAANLQRTSIATLSSFCSARAGTVAAARAFLSTSTRKQFGDGTPNIPKGFADIKTRQKTFNIDNGLR